VEKPLPIITQKDLTIDALFPACDGNPILELSNEGSVDSGLVVRATGVTIRGFYISGFNKYDIWLDGEAKSTSQGTNPRRCVIEQNVLSNRTDHRIGIALIGDCFGNIIRGNQLIRCNDSAGLLIRGLKARYNRVVGNLLGTNRQGDDSLAQAYGVWLDQGANNNTIGGAKKGEANYISGNYEYGVLISGKDTAANRVTANKIGVSPYDDKSPLGNQRAGVKIEKQAHDNRLDGNLFLDNNNGLHIWSGAHTNQIFFNTFQSNREREIWIGENSNDAAQENWLLGNTLKHARIPVQLGERLGAPPAKPNAGVQTPRNFTASLAGSTVKVTGGAGSTNPNAAVEVYLARKLDPAAYDYLFLGSFQAGGGGELNATLPLQNVGPLKPGDQLALIATAGNGNTSEFSSPVAL